MKCHIGVDAFTGMVHTCEATAANVADIDVAPKLLRKDDEVAYGDSAYTGLEKRKEIKADENLSKIDFRTNTKKPYRKKVWKDGPGIFWRNYMEYRKSSVRSKVEYVFHIMNNIFGYKRFVTRAWRRTLPSKTCCLPVQTSICSVTATCSKSRGLPTKGVLRPKPEKNQQIINNPLIKSAFPLFFQCLPF